MKYFIFMLETLFFVCACSVKPDDPGLCKLNCAKAVIAGNDIGMKIEFTTTPVAVSCPAAAGGQPLTDAFFVQFLVSEEFDNGTDVKGHRPVPNVSIEPITDGSRSDLPAHNPNVAISGTFYNPERYKALITPKDNWCTDSCGVVSLEVFGQCPAPGGNTELGVQIHTGALYSNEMVFPINTLEAN